MSYLPYLSLSRLCGLELGIHVTANGPHDGVEVDRVPDANLSAVLGAKSRFVDGKYRQPEDITFNFSFLCPIPLSKLMGKIIDKTFHELAPRFQREPGFTQSLTVM